MTRPSIVIAGVAICLLAAVDLSRAQTIGYAEAVARLGASCGKDINQLCKNVGLGGGRIQQCLGRNQAAVSPACNAAVADLAVLLRKRAAARAAVVRVCERDIRALCSGVQAGDGNLMECFYKAKQHISAPCQGAWAD